jgi:non-ribosomal peptide synthase protein (TIGR01720 family)
MHDNFFNLGGDSILSIQVVSRAIKAGLRLTPRQMFEHQTIAALAEAAGTTDAIAAEQGLVSGDVQLTPIQCWFFERGLSELHHFNQAVLLSVPPRLEFDWLDRAIGYLISHHDSLRLRFEKGNDEWRQFNLALEERQICERVDLSEVRAEDRTAAIEAHAARAQTSLDLTQGPLQRVVYFDFGGGERGRLLWVIHHLVVDGVSWRILLEDLATLYGQLAGGDEMCLGPKTTSYQAWAERLREYGDSPDLLDQLAYWTEQGRPNVACLPVDLPGENDSRRSVRTVRVSLNTEDTLSLLQSAPKAYRTQINDLLLAALGQTLCWWSRAPAVIVDLEAHGREEEIGGVDVSRTVGWFTSIYPVRLEAFDPEAPGDLLKRIKEQLRRVPLRGLGHGILKYCCDADVRAQMSGLAKAEVSFNYLGQVDQIVSESEFWGAAGEGVGPNQSEQASRTHLLEIEGLVVGGQLRLTWAYSAAVHREETIEQLAAEYIERLRALIAHCVSPEAGGYTPSDFPKAALTQEDLDELLAELQ